MDELRGRWPACVAHETALRDRLLAAYAAPERGYHDTRHLAEVLDRLDDLLGRPEASRVDREAVLLAAWFHDAVYDGEPTDEERSAVLAETTLPPAGAPAAVVGEVARLVRLTRSHAPEPHDHAGQVLCDADLAVLASGRERYDEYVAGVRREHAHLDDAEFRHGRAAVLRALLEKPVLFHTPSARERWETAARDNLRRELGELVG